MGEIPKGWEKTTWGKVINRCSAGATPYRGKPEYFRGEIPWITSSELNYNLIPDSNEKISKEGMTAANLELLPKGTFLMAITGLEAKGTRGSCGITGIESTTNQSCMAIFPSERLKTEFLYHYYVFNGENLAFKYCQGTKQQSYTAEIVKTLPITIPTDIIEQEAIAESLSDTDTTLESLEQLIAKKRDIKQGAIQELLTGKTRLPGFSEEWKSKLMPNICWFQEGPGVRNTQFMKSGVKLLNGTNIFQGNLYLERTDRYISEHEAYGLYSHFLVDVEDIVIACSGITIKDFHKKIAVVKKWHLPLCMNTSTMRFKPKKDKLAKQYLFQYLLSNHFKQQISGKATGSAQLNFGPTHVSKVRIGLPPLAEQQAIANILSDMDKEITALEKRRDKLMDLKQGMMQQLLTGRIRLVEAKA